MARNWIASAVKKPGSFSAAAKRAGESTAQFARQKAGAPGKMGQRARLAETLMGMSKKRGGGLPGMSKPAG